MANGTGAIMLSLIRSAVCNQPLTENEKRKVYDDLLPDIFELSKTHDVAHLVALGLKNNGLFIDSDETCQKFQTLMFQAVMRAERHIYALSSVSNVLESAKIPFIPLKGSILRNYYPESWMRTSCDIDVLVHKEDLEKAISCLCENAGCVLHERSVHDVSLFTKGNVHIELHFDLVEEGRANRASEVLSTVWDYATPKQTYKYKMELSDAMFHFYHVAHMAKHFEKGGCGVRTFIDLWILENLASADVNGRKVLLKKGGLLRFYEVSLELSHMWLEKAEATETAKAMGSFILNGGSFGTSLNRVALQQRRKGGKVGYIVSRMFIPYHQLRRYYPVLEKHRWLMPLMQVRRWGMLFKPDVAKMAKSEMSANSKIDKTQADKMEIFLKNIGL